MEEKIKVLILEDLPSDAELAEREVKSVLKNYKTMVADTEQGFIKALENFKPDLIISDYKLPTFDGMKALQITRKKEEYIPFIILTGSMNEETAVECMKAGADDYVIKEHIKRLGPSIINALDKKKIMQERKQAEEALRKSEMKFRNLSESTLMGIALYQNDYWIYANPAAEEISGYTFDELKQMKFWEFTAPEYVDLIKERGRARQKGKLVPSGYEFKIITKQGKEKWVLLTGNTTELKSGKAGLITVLDITERKWAEEALKTSLQQIEMINANTPNIIWKSDIDKQGNFINTYISEVVDEFLALPKGTINNSWDKYFSYIIPDYLPQINELFKKAIANPGQLFTFSYEVKKADGKKAWFTSSGRIRVENDKLTVYGSTADITERKQAETELTKLSTAVTQSPSIIIITDTEGNLQYGNPKFTEITGYSLEEAIGQNPSILKSGYLPDKMYKELWETISSGKTWRGEFHNKKKNGELYWEMASVSPVFDEQGNIINYIKVAEDITERKQAEDNFRHSIDESPLGIRIVSQAGKTIYVNKALLDIYEYSSLDEFNNTKAIDRYTGKSYQEHQERKKIRQEGGDISDYEISIRRKNGAIRHIKVWRKEVIWNREKHFQVINQDITELKRLTTDLILAKEKAEESDRLKTAFLNNMSHEIRTPLNGITGFISLLQDSEIDDEEKQEYFDIIKKSSDRLIATVTDIINISRIEAGEVKVSKAEVSINEILDEQYKFFYHEAQSKGLELIYKPTVSDNESRIVTDKYKLEGIMTNLIKNAIKFTDSGNIKFGYTIKTRGEKDIVEFYVKDTGIGIPENRIDAIFNHFEQADITDTRAFQGLGLGLAIAKSYVEMLGGKIGVKSKEGEGSTFTFTIPYTKPLEEKNDAKENLKKEPQIDLSHLSVIIAEDDETSRMFLEIILKKQFKHITFTTTGKETIEKLRKNPDTDIILMDIKMPDMSGYDATREIRKFNQDVIIIAQTAHGLSGDREKALEAGCNDHISKPIKKEILFEKIRACLDKKGIKR